MIGPGLLQRLLEGFTQGGRIVTVGKSVRDEDPTWEFHAISARPQLLLVARFGDDELDVGVCDVDAEMFPSTRIVQSCNDGTDQTRTTEGKDVVRRVVHEKANVGRTARVEPGTVEGGKTLRFGQEFSMRPLAIAEAQGRTVGKLGIATVPSQECCGVRTGERHLGQRRGEPSERCIGCHRDLRPALSVRPHVPSRLTQPAKTMADHSLLSSPTRSGRGQLEAAPHRGPRSDSNYRARCRSSTDDPAMPRQTTRPSMALPCRCARAQALGATKETDDVDLKRVLVGEDNTVPRERYTSREFADLELERLWSRVWQVACREEEVAEVGGFCEYLIGDQLILVVRSDADTVRA